jgi:hypothetical protein
MHDGSGGDLIDRQGGVSRRNLDDQLGPVWRQLPRYYCGFLVRRECDHRLWRVRAVELPQRLPAGGVSHRMVAQARVRPGKKCWRNNATQRAALSSRSGGPTTHATNVNQVTPERFREPKATR